MTDLIKRIEIGEETFEDRMAVTNRICPAMLIPTDAPFRSVQIVIDAVERLLPGVDVVIKTCGAHVPGWTAVILDDHPEEGEPWWLGGFADTPARALLAALLKALDRDNDQIG